MPATTNRNRVTRKTVWALRARLHLYQQDWADAEQVDYACEVRVALASGREESAIAEILADGQVREQACILEDIADPPLVFWDKGARLWVGERRAIAEKFGHDMNGPCERRRPGQIARACGDCGSSGGGCGSSCGSGSGGGCGEPVRRGAVGVVTVERVEAPVIVVLFTEIVERDLARCALAHELFVCVQRLLNFGFRREHEHDFLRPNA